MAALAGFESTTGTKGYVALGEPAGGAYTASALAALVWQPIVGLRMFPEWGDTHSDVTDPVVGEGRVLHQNGAADGGEVALPVQHRETDPGGDILKEAAGTDDIVTVLKVYPSGDGEVASGVVGNGRRDQAAQNSVRGRSYVLRVNTAVTDLTAADVTTALA